MLDLDLVMVLEYIIYGFWLGAISLMSYLSFALWYYELQKPSSTCNASESSTQMAEIISLGLQSPEVESDENPDEPAATTPTSASNNYYELTEDESETEESEDVTFGELVTATTPYLKNLGLQLKTKFEQPAALFKKYILKGENGLKVIKEAVYFNADITGLFDDEVDDETETQAPKEHDDCEHQQDDSNSSQSSSDEDGSVDCLADESLSDFVML